MLEHMKGEISPSEARGYLDNLGITEDCYSKVMKGHPVLDGLSGHDLKTLVTIARSSIPLDYGQTYFQMKEQYPQT